MAHVPEDSEMEQEAAKSPSLDSLIVEFKILGESSLQAGGLADSDNDRLWWLLACALQAAGPL
jgi:hypothetical protein